MAALNTFGTAESLDSLSKDLQEFEEEELEYEHALNKLKVTNLASLLAATKDANAKAYQQALSLEEQLTKLKKKSLEEYSDRRWKDTTKYIQLEIDALAKREENAKKLYELTQLISEANVKGEHARTPEEDRLEAAKKIADLEDIRLENERKKYKEIYDARLKAESEIYATIGESLQNDLDKVEEQAKGSREAILADSTKTASEKEAALLEVEKKRIADRAALEIKANDKVKEAGDKAAKQQEKLQQRAEAKKKKDARKKAILDGKQDGISFQDPLGLGQGLGWISGGAVGNFLKSAKGKSGIDDDGIRHVDLKAAFGAIAGLAKQLETTIEDIQKTQSEIDTRLQGSKQATSKNLMGGQSYWQQMSKDITGIAGISPLVQQSKIVDNLKTLVSQGISFNVEQRAVMESLKDKIATTFNAANGTLLRLVRIQQQDTTASRLGMESALTHFLNNMYETTEYMQGIADSVKSSIEESMALMDGRSAVEYEYQVQKWMGSLYSVGMDNSSVTNIAQALGQIAAGDISGLTGSGTGNLMVMAANNAGLNLAEILADGLDGSKTNQLMEAMVNYLSKIYNDSNNSRVLQQQFANVYGLKASDLKAASNLSMSVNDIATTSMTYNDSLTQLTNMANSMYQRTSAGELLNNAWSNFQYTVSSGIANNPAMYAIYKVANLLDATVGGIDLPTVSVMGNSIDLPKVSDLLSAGALAGGMISGIGSLIVAGGNGGATGEGILKAAGLNTAPASVSRGDGGGLYKKQRGMSTSTSGYAGNNASGDVYDSTVEGANNDAKAQQAQAKEENQDATMTDVNNTVGNIYDLLRDVVSGMSSLTVRMVGTVGEGWN